MLWQKDLRNTSKLKGRDDQEIAKPAKLAVQSRKSKDTTYSTISFQGQRQQIILFHSVTTATKKCMVASLIYSNSK